MNRIILIGNGFDLAHGLHTSYSDFIRNYLDLVRLGLTKCASNMFDDGLYKITLKNNGIFGSLDMLVTTPETPESDDWRQYLVTRDQTHYVTINKCRLMDHILYNMSNKNWVDIENAYYLLLKNSESCFDNNVSDLNKNMSCLREKLSGYLHTIQDKYIKREIYKRSIESIIYAPINYRDISEDGKVRFNQFLSRKWNSANKEGISSVLKAIGLNNAEQIHLAVEYRGSQFKNEFSLLQDVKDNERSTNVPYYYLAPDNIMLLNFNYTNTAKMYHRGGPHISINHIHGELDNPNNPIIFGYGDELDEGYRILQNKNDNRYTENFKSIRYLETDNYKKLLSFINSDIYQVYILGHSCGNSDRTLLNTLFEHPNCVSIKPYYYQRTDGSDNYMEIVQNISRDFNDMTKMRDRVVNKTYCEIIK